MCLLVVVVSGGAASVCVSCEAGGTVEGVKKSWSVLVRRDAFCLSSRAVSEDVSACRFAGRSVALEDPGQ